MDIEGSVVDMFHDPFTEDSPSEVHYICSQWVSEVHT